MTGSAAAPIRSLVARSKVRSLAGRMPTLQALRPGWRRAAAASAPPSRAYLQEGLPVACRSRARHLACLLQVGADVLPPHSPPPPAGADQPGRTCSMGSASELMIELLVCSDSDYLVMGP